ncbi:MAG TPA: hypothetical protein VE397_03700 [Stellaceae bacterium]|nr:hypothetical protein [Stellaceae bacterium]
MPIVELRIASTQVAARMDEVREWLRDRQSVHKLTSTGSSGETLVVIEFVSAAEADDFARQFSGSVVPG